LHPAAKKRQGAACGASFGRNASNGKRSIHVGPVFLATVTGPATSKTTDKLRSLARSMRVAGRRLSNRRAIGAVVGITVFVAVAVFVPLPSAVQLRDWAHSVGPWFPLAFLIAHIVVTVFPIPRTPFTLAAGLLFGPFLGVLIAVVASTLAAVLAAVLVRSAGWQLQRLVRHQAMQRVDEQLHERGWVAFLSLRMIPVLPFSALNYTAGASAVGMLPFTLTTVAGLLPGTAAIVFLGDALAGHPSPWLFAVSVFTSVLGLTGLFFEVRHYRKRDRRTSEPDEHEAEPAIVG
jgi:uncharacterized membrane protein YdjX (TVP38/TMEM64 family)